MKKKQKKKTLIKEVLYFFFSKDPTFKIFGKKAFNKKDKMGWNIYKPNAILGEHLREFNRINYWLKNKLIIPIVLVVGNLFKKYLVKKIPDYWYNKNIIIFERAYEKSIKDWAEKYIPHITGKTMSKKAIKEYYMNSPACRMLRTMKDIVVTVCLIDTAYREFLNVLMHNSAQEMVKEYKDQEVNHVFYTDKNVYDVKYLVLGKVITNNKIKIKRK